MNLSWEPNAHIPLAFLQATRRQSHREVTCIYRELPALRNRIALSAPASCPLENLTCIRHTILADGLGEAFPSRCFCIFELDHVFQLLNLAHSYCFLLVTIVGLSHYVAKLVPMESKSSSAWAFLLPTCLWDSLGPSSGLCLIGERSIRLPSSFCEPSLSLSLGYERLSSRSILLLSFLRVPKCGSGGEFGSWAGAECDSMLSSAEYIDSSCARWEGGLTSEMEGEHCSSMRLCSLTISIHSFSRC